MGAQSKVTKSAAGASKSATPKSPKTPKKLVPTYKHLLLLFTCLESVLARPDVSPIEWEVISKALNRPRGSVSSEYCKLRQAILRSQEGEDQEEDAAIDSPTKDKEIAETLDQDMVTDEI